MAHVQAAQGSEVDQLCHHGVVDVATAFQAEVVNERAANDPQVGSCYVCDREIQGETPFWGQVGVPVLRVLSFSLTVGKGETLQGLATKYGIPEAVLLRANKGSRDVRERQKLNIEIGTRHRLLAEAVEEELAEAAAAAANPASRKQEQERGSTPAASAAASSSAAQRQAEGGRASEAELEVVQVSPEADALQQQPQQQQQWHRSSSLSQKVDHIARTGRYLGSTSVKLAGAALLLGGALFVAKNFFEAHLQVAAEDEASREEAEAVVGKERLSELLEQQQARAERIASGSKAATPTGKQVERDPLPEPLPRPQPPVPGAAGEEGEEAPQHLPPAWLALPALTFIQLAGSGEAMTVALLQDERVWLAFEDPKDAEAFAAMLRAWGAPPLDLARQPPVSLTVAAAANGGAIAFLPRGAMKVDVNMDEEAMVTGLVQHAQVLSHASLTQLLERRPDDAMPRVSGAVEADAIIPPDETLNPRTAPRNADPTNQRRSSNSTASTSRRPDDVGGAGESQRSSPPDSAGLVPPRPPAEAGGTPDFEALLERVRQPPRPGSRRAAGPQPPGSRRPRPTPKLPTSQNGAKPDVRPSANGSGPTPSDSQQSTARNPSPSASPGVTASSSIGSSSSRIDMHERADAAHPPRAPSAGWWTALEVVLVPMVFYSDGGQAFVTVNMTEDPDVAGKSLHAIGFQDRKDSQELQYLFQSWTEFSSSVTPGSNPVSIQIMPMDPARLAAEAAARSFGVTVFRRHALRLRPDLTVGELGGLAFAAAKAQDMR